MKTVHTLALAVALALASPLVVHAAPGDAAESVTLGAERRGEITSRSSLNHQDGSRSQLYRVDLREGQVASFKLEGALRGKLTAFQGGDLVGASLPIGPLLQVRFIKQTAVFNSCAHLPRQHTCKAVVQVVQCVNALCLLRLGLRCGLRHGARTGRCIVGVSQQDAGQVGLCLKLGA